MGKTPTLTIDRKMKRLGPLNRFIKWHTPLGKPMEVRYNMKVINQRDDTA